MQTTFFKTSIQFLYNHLEKMRSLPEDPRKIFVVVSMIFGSISIGIVSWLMFAQLQDLNLPSLDSNQQQMSDNGQSYNQDANEPTITAHTNFADASNIPQIGPVAGFIESFKAVTTLIVPKDVQNNTNASLSWSQSVSHISASIISLIQKLCVLAFQTLEHLYIYLLGIINAYISRIADLLAPHINI